MEGVEVYYTWCVAGVSEVWKSWKGCKGCITNTWRVYQGVWRAGEWLGRCVEGGVVAREVCGGWGSGPQCSLHWVKRQAT